MALIVKMVTDIIFEGGSITPRQEVLEAGLESRPSVLDGGDSRVSNSTIGNGYEQDEYLVMVAR